MTDLTIKGDATDIDETTFDWFKDLLTNSYAGKNDFVKDVLNRAEKFGSVTAKQINAVAKVVKSDDEYARKNKERLARMTPMKDGKGEVIGEVISIKQQENHFNYGRTYVYKMLVEDFKGYRVFGSVPSFLLDEEVKVGDFVKFEAKLRQKELGFGFYSYPKNSVIVDAEEGTVMREAFSALKPKPKDKETLKREEVAEKKAETTRELMDFLSA
jgi:hypothetical protein|tara:strand:+ start:1520 stop:2161 length:642 start_codon:yes stop_codon:yes gene_type:complete